MRKEKYSKYIWLFIFTFITCMISGAQWQNKNIMEILNWQYGITYAILILTFLSSHEFGHYFAARYYGIQTTLPYYIPFPFPIALNFGTMGAVIRIKEPVTSKKALFDIGIAGPIAGFIVCCIFLIIGLETLPGKEYIYQIHPEYLQNGNGAIPMSGLYFGDTLLYSLFSKLFANPNGFLPPMNEIYHYPFLNVGWFGLFVTAMNLLPMGQLDGGHITYSIFGTKGHYAVSRAFFWLLLILGLLGAMYEWYLYLDETNATTILTGFGRSIYLFFQYFFAKFPILKGMWTGWLVWAILAKFVIRLKHPPVENEDDIGTPRKMLGILALLMLLGSFSINAIYII
ncbi:MAG: site-2 protease family protein [Chloroherpetonaceae bacterium]